MWRITTVMVTRSVGATLAFARKASPIALLPMAKAALRVSHGETAAGICHEVTDEV